MRRFPVTDQVVTEALLREALAALAEPYVVSGFAVAAASGLSVSVSAGAAFVGGYHLVMAEPATVEVAANGESRVYLTASGVIGAAEAVPAGAVLLATVTADASAVVTVVDGRELCGVQTVSDEARTLAGHLLLHTGPLAAKGDLLAATSAEGLTRVPVGATGQVLMADAGQAAGMRWGNAPIVIAAVKSTNETLAGSATLQDDDHLHLTVLPNRVYLMQLHLAHTGSTVGFKYMLTAPSGAAVTAHLYYKLGGTSTHGYTPNVNLLSQQTTAPDGVGVLLRLTGVLTTGGSGGEVTVQWAQAAANAAVHTLNKGSQFLLIDVTP